jgi:putative ABC transport system permease protein
MSIRRVFGANYLQVILLLFKEYGSILLVGFLIVVPVANSLIKEWLMTFPYKIHLSPAHFIVPVMSLIILITVIIFLKSHSTAKTNPAKVLKDE